MLKYRVFASLVILGLIVFAEYFYMTSLSNGATLEQNQMMSAPNPNYQAPVNGYNAGYTGYGYGGFQGPMANSAISTVSSAKLAWDDSHVTLIGFVTQRVSDDKYIFQDQTGEILVEIDHEVFAGRLITPQTPIRIFGEVDRELFERTKIDVDWLEVVQN